MKGKDKCELLRSIRQSIAELNGIQYSPKECDHDECSIGTCPLCEEEVFWLMDELRKKTLNVAFVLNEYGATVGMITLEDLLEEIVGEIRDEYDTDEEELIMRIDDSTFLIEGSMKLDDINDALGTDFDSEDYDSIGGIIIEYLDRLPEDGDTVTLHNGIRLQVVGTEQNHI